MHQLFFYAINTLTNKIGSAFEEVGFLRPDMTEDAIIFAEFDGNNDRIVNLLTEIMNHVKTTPKDRYGNEKVLLEIFPIVDLVEEPIYSLIVAHNIGGIREKSIALLQKYDKLQSVGVVGEIDDIVDVML